MRYKSLVDHILKDIPADTPFTDLIITDKINDLLETNGNAERVSEKQVHAALYRLTRRKLLSVVRHKTYTKP